MTLCLSTSDIISFSTVFSYRFSFLFFFFFNDTATTEIYTLSLHDALPISEQREGGIEDLSHCHRPQLHGSHWSSFAVKMRSEEHTSELQSRLHLVCRLLLEKKKKNIYM